MEPYDRPERPEKPFDPTNDYHVFVEQWFKACKERPPKRGSLEFWQFVCNHDAEYMAWCGKRDSQSNWYAFTLTTNEKDQIKWPQIEEAMRFASHKILTQESQPVESGAAYLEYQESGAPHIHGYYKLPEGKRIYPKTFKRYWPLWNEKKRCGLGHVGGYHKEMKSESYKDYAGCEERLVSKI